MDTGQITCHPEGPLRSLRDIVDVANPTTTTTSNKNAKSLSDGMARSGGIWACRKNGDPPIQNQKMGFLSVFPFNTPDKGYRRAARTADGCEIHFASPFGITGMIGFPCKCQRTLWFQLWFHCVGATWISQPSVTTWHVQSGL